MKLGNLPRTWAIPAFGLLLLAGCQQSIDPVTLAPGESPGREAGAADKNKETSTACTEFVTHSEEGVASWYGKSRQGRKTASGERLDMNAPTAAHRNLPFGSRIRVTNLENGKTTILTVNDRGPFKKGRILDVAQKSASELGFVRQGLAQVRVEMAEATGADC